LACSARSSVAGASSAFLVVHSFQATMERAKSSSTVHRQNQPQPITFTYAKSVCHSWLGAVVLSLNPSAALITMKAGLAIRSCAFNRRKAETTEANKH